MTSLRTATCTASEPVLVGQARESTSGASPRYPAIARIPRRLSLAGASRPFATAVLIIESLSMSAMGYPSMASEERIRRSIGRKIGPRAVESRSVRYKRYHSRYFMTDHRFFPFMANKSRKFQDCATSTLFVYKRYYSHEQTCKIGLNVATRQKRYGPPIHLPRFW